MATKALTKQKRLDLDKITIDGETQPRAEINTDVVAEYQADIESGKDMPPADVFHDGAKTWMADGFHRYFAYKRAGKKDMPCNIHEGTRDDALWHAVGANKEHGLRRSNEDKEKAVTMALSHPEGAKKSDNVLAKHVGVSPPFVAKIRKLTINIYSQTERVGQDGRTIDTANIGKLDRNEVISGLANQAQKVAEDATDAELKKLAKLSPEKQVEIAKAVRHKEAASISEALSGKDGSSPGKGKDKPADFDDPCPVCSKKKWVKSPDGVICEKCGHPHGEPAGDVDDDRLKTQRSKTVKTVEALMRAFDDLQCMLAKPEHDKTIKTCKGLLEIARGWK